MPRSPLQDGPASLPGFAAQAWVRADYARLSDHAEHRGVTVGVRVEIAPPEVDVVLLRPGACALHFARTVTERRDEAAIETPAFVGREIIRKKIVELPGVARGSRSKR